MTSLGRGAQLAGNFTAEQSGSGRALQTVGTTRGPRKHEDDRLYSSKPDAQDRRYRYATSEEYRTKQNKRCREWRKQKKQDPLWQRYEAVRVMINNQKGRIKRTTWLLGKQERRLLSLCREFVQLKKCLEGK